MSQLSQVSGTQAEEAPVGQLTSRNLTQSKGDGYKMQVETPGFRSGSVTPWAQVRSWRFLVKVASIMPGRAAVVSL